jgi:aerobic carbon-monoxide dehydrogenase small subunit
VKPAEVTIAVNGRSHRRTVEPRTTLVDFLRDELRLTGTHTGCEHGVCGACSVLLDGEPVRSCLMFAVQADGRQVTTVEGLAPGPGELSVLQDAFWETHAMQCGFCTPGMLIAGQALLDRTLDPSRDDIVEAIGGNLCRCTGYQQIIEAIELAARRLREGNAPHATAGA